jgi:hypothetical protein
VTYLVDKLHFGIKSRVNVGERVDLAFDNASSPFSRSALPRMLGIKVATEAIIDVASCFARLDVMAFNVHCLFYVLSHCEALLGCWYQRLV